MAARLTTAQRGADAYHTHTGAHLMQAYLGQASLKRALLKEITAHVKADRLIKGTYGDAEAARTFKGCAVGCALHSLNRVTKHPGMAVDDHRRFETELGVPVELAYVIDRFFEALPQKDSQTWPERVMRAIPVGADLRGVVPALLQWAIVDPTYGWMTYAKTPASRAVVARFAGLVARDWDGDGETGTVTATEWAEIEQALDRALPEWARARARAWAGAAAGAWARARARAWAWAGAWAGAWANYETWYQAASTEAIRLIAASPVPVED